MGQAENFTNFTINGSTVLSISDKTRSTFDIIYFYVYFVVLPAIFIVGIPGNVAIFVLLVRKAKCGVTSVSYGMLHYNCLDLFVISNVRDFHAILNSWAGLLSQNTCDFVKKSNIVATKKRPSPTYRIHFEMIDVIVGVSASAALLEIGQSISIILKWLKRVIINEREVSYIFHGIITMNAVVCLSGCSLIMANWYWCENMINSGPLWIRRSSILMYSSAFVFDQTCNVLITAAPCLTLTCSIDRFVAIYHPMAYMSYTAETRRNLIFLSSIGIYLFGTLLSISDVFRYNVVFDPISETFIVSEDEQYISKLLPKILVAVRSCSRIVIIFIVIVVNVMILIKYHFVSTKRKKLTVSVSSDQGKTRQNSSRDQAALAAMLFVQTILMVIGHVPMSVSYILIYVDSENSSSSGRRYFNMFVNVAFCAEMACIFVVLLLTNRKLASSLLKCCGSKEDTSVTMAMASKMK